MFHAAKVEVGLPCLENDFNAPPYAIERSGGRGIPHGALNIGDDDFFMSSRLLCYKRGANIKGLEVDIQPVLRQTSRDNLFEDFPVQWKLPHSEHGTYHDNVP